MRIIVDAFGGDNAPLEVLRGCAMAVKEYGVDIIACGSEKTIRIQFLPGPLHGPFIKIRQLPEQPVDFIRIQVKIREGVFHSPQGP